MPEKKQNATLLENGLVVCPACLCSSDKADRVIRDGDTYGNDSCDRCGAIPQPTGN